MSELRPYSCHERLLDDLVTAAGVTGGVLETELTETGFATCAGVELAATAERSVVALTASKVGACAGNPVL